MIVGPAQPNVLNQAPAPVLREEKEARRRAREAQASGGSAAEAPTALMRALIASSPFAGLAAARIVFVNGRYEPGDRASISVFDHGFLYGLLAVLISVGMGFLAGRIFALV